MTDNDLAGLAKYFQHFADVHVVQSSPLYAVLARRVAATESLLRLAARATPGQPAANLLFASVQFLLRQGSPDEPLRAYYPTLGGERAPGDGNPADLFEDYVLARAAHIVPLLSTRITNTNEVGRCGVLIAGFKLVSEEASAPLHMVEIGPSVGLNLSWDEFHYDHGGVTTGPADSAVRIAPALRGAGQLPLDGAIPEVASRCGLELHPSPVGDDDTLNWQLALVFPEHVDRAGRLAAAFSIARQSGHEIIQGDAVTDLGALIERLPDDGAVCVYHSQTTYQIPHDKRQALSESLCAARRRRPVWRVGFEWLDGARALESGDHALGVARYEGGGCTYQHLAFCDPHGRWLEWGPTNPEDTDRL